MEEAIVIDLAWGAEGVLHPDGMVTSNDMAPRQDAETEKPELVDPRRTIPPADREDHRAGGFVRKPFG